MKTLTLLGSTGSIGTQTLEVADLRDDIKIAALCANENVALIEKQIRKYKPRFAALMNEEKANELKIKVADTDTTVLSGMEGFIECVKLPEVDMVLTAVVGVCGLIPTIEAIRAGKDIALANKETLVAGGDIVMPLAKEMGIKILPVDSEHSAIFQSMQGAEKRISKILLTASGGPFFGKSKDKIYGATVEDALNHPNWSMGAKITVDSASMMNKGLEIIEATHLFDVPADKIEVLIHRQSIVHSMVQYADNSVIAQLSTPDMKLPIAYALSYPNRAYCGTKELDFCELGRLTFDKPDYETFRCLGLAI
ncbi:MAG: 1-deoxy-D-xylulose-5-phosphate reductoisomerase, partial [Clostridia bacterium]|nr:1-deoxy-D-xylulose-5-phosphate reductoisomerase [Clostridia bacterium]